MKIGFIGLGNVGAKLAGSLLRNKFGLVVRDTDREATQQLLDQGAQWGESGQKMAQLCDVIIIYVTDCTYLFFGNSIANRSAAMNFPFVHSTQCTDHC